MSRLKTLFALTLPALLAPTGMRLSSQANVVEDQTTYVYADAQAGSDSNSGAQTSPFKTVQAAVNKANSFNQQGIGVKVIVNPGVYRETVTIGNYRVTSAPLTVQAATTGTAIIDGADVLTGWTLESNGISYARSWTYGFGDCAVPSGWPTTFAEIGKRREMIFVNGTPLTQVMNYSDLKPGTFFVNETYSVIHVAPPAGTNMSTATVEAAARAQTLNAVSRTNLVLRGLVFQHAAACINAPGAAINSSNNVLIDTVQADWNNWGGLGVFGSTNVTIQNSVASYNGGVGFMGNKDVNVLLNSNESDYNNWRGAQAAFYDWGMGGTKFFQTHGATVQNHYSYNNQAQGLWFDTDNKNITITNSTLSGNVQAALQIERNEGPITLQNSSLCSSGQGVNVLTSTGITIENNAFYNNSGTNKFQAEIFIAGQAGGKIITDWQTGQNYDLFTTGMVLSGNTFQNAAPGQLVFGTYLGGSDWTQFASTLNSSKNTWYDPTTTSSFKVVNGKVVNLNGFQNTVQTDYTSSWALPAALPATCAAPTPSFTDFSVNVDVGTTYTYTMASGVAVANVRVNSFGFTSPASLNVTGLPSGVTASFSQASLLNGAATLTFSASKSAKAQTVPVTVWAVSGNRVHSSTFYLQVVPL